MKKYLVIEQENSKYKKDVPPIFYSFSFYKTI